MELRKAIAIELSSEEYQTLIDASFLITRIAKNIRKYGANGVACNTGTSNDEKCFEEMDVWNIASEVEDLANVQHMYGRDWKVEIVDES